MNEEEVFTREQIERAFERIRKSGKVSPYKNSGPITIDAEMLLKFLRKDKLFTEPLA